LAAEVLFGVKSGQRRGGVYGRALRMLWGGWETYPDVEVEVLVRYRFDVESYGGYCGDDLANLDCAVSFVRPSKIWRASAYL
jgi:hypothetical protein